MVIQLEKQREQQQVRGAEGGQSKARQEDQQGEYDWEVVEERREFKSKRGDRSMSASPILVKKVKTWIIRDLACRVIGEQQQ